MWAYRLVAPRAFERVSVEPPAQAQLASDQVILRVEIGGVCGTDLPVFKGLMPEWFLPGQIGVSLHEVVGEVVASRSERLQVGARVVGWASGSDALAEYIATDASGLFEFDGGLDAQRAIVLQPLAAVLSTMDRFGAIAGAAVAILGIGPIGAIFAHVAKQRGAKSITGVDVIDRSRLAQPFGIDEFCQQTASVWQRSLSDEGRPEIVIEAIGHQVGTLTAAVNAVADRGRILYFGVPDDPVYPIPMLQLVTRQLELSGGWTPAPERLAALQSAQDYLTRYPTLADAVVTDVLPFGEAQRAFEMACQPASSQLKIALTA